MLGNFGQDVSSLEPYFLSHFYSHLFSQRLKKNNVLWANNLVGRNESDW